ncbi:MAG: putative S-layer protein [Candidatus Nanoarchaeia archaeon]
MKKSYLSAIFLAVALFVVTAASAATIDITTITTPSGNPGAAVTVTATLVNSGSTTISSVVFQSSDLTGPEGNVIPAPTISNLLNLVPTTPTPKAFTVNLPYKKAGTYSGTLTATSASDASNTDTIAYSVTINSVYGVDVVDRDNDANKMVVTADQGDRVTSTFRVKNTGSITLTDLAWSYVQTDFEDSDGDKIIITQTGLPASLEPGAEATVTLTINVDDAVKMDTYDGVITVSTAAGAKSDTFTLEVRVQPEVCSDGKKGNLKIDLREPDSGDDFKPGEKIPIEVKVENNADDDLDIVVTAFLYDVDDGDNVEEVDSDTINIDEDDTETFEFDLIVPEDVDDSHEFRLYVKAYEDGNEDEQCSEASVKIDIKREKNDVIVKNIRINPSTAKVGDTVSIEVTVQNIGSRDQKDVTVKVLNSELGLDLISKSFGVEKFDKDDTQIERFTFKIPEGVESGTYDIEAIVTFGSRTASSFAPMKVEAPALPPEPFAMIEVANVPTTLEAGKAFDMSVKVTNTGQASERFTVEVSNLASWADAVQSQTITLGAGKTGTLFFTIQTKATATGSQSASVSVLSGNEVLDSQTISVNLQEAGAVEGQGIDFGNLFSGTTLWIIADIILVIIAIIFIRMLFRSRKRE